MIPTEQVSSLSLFIPPDFLQFAPLLKHTGNIKVLRMSESLLEVLSALSDEDEEVAVLLELIRHEERREEIQQVLKYTVDTSDKENLVHDLVEIESFIQNGRAYRGEAPILKLPYDVLSEIALVFSLVQENGAWLFSSVCRAWREIALSTPRAWTTIDLRANHTCSRYDHTRFFNIHHSCTIRTPDPALCIERARTKPFHLELHDLPSHTPNLPEFIFDIMPHVQRLHIHESPGSEIRISPPAPKLRELLIMRSPRTTDISAEDFTPSSLFLLDLLGGRHVQTEWAPTFSRLQVARFHEINWNHDHIAGFKQLRALTLSDCKCEAVDHLHELLRTNSKTLEHLHLSVYPTIMSESQVFQPILLPKLRKLSFLVAQEELDPHSLRRGPIVSIASHAITLFQSLVIPQVTELQVFAPCIQDLELATHCPSLQHLYLIVPRTTGELSPYVRNVRTLLIVAPLQTIDLFIAPRHKSHSYEMAIALGPFLRDPSVLWHPILMGFTLKSNLDFEPLREAVRDEWKRVGKRLDIRSASEQEWRSNGFTILEDNEPCSQRTSDLFIPYSDWYFDD